MAVNALLWFADRFRPKEGWLSLSLLAAIVVCLTAAVLEVNWVPEAGVVGITAVFSLLLSYLLAKRAQSAPFAWILILLYGLLVTLLRLANLAPPASVVQQGFWPLRSYWLQNGALFLDRSVSWLLAVAGGNKSQETIIFAFGLGLGIWLLTALAVWSAIRLEKPLLGLSFIGIAMALNGFFGVAPIWYLAFFIGLTTLLAATMNLNTLEQSWRQRGLDFSEEIRLEILVYAGIFAFTLLMLSLSLPTFSITKLVDAFLSHPWVTGVEETLDDAFGGVNQPRSARPPGSPGGYGVMPRSYLLGDSPELTDVVMMAAIVTDLSGTPIPMELIQRMHWRGLSYEIYTGRGWTLSEEREEPLPAGEVASLPAKADAFELIQQVRWVRDERLLRYTLGEPLQFDHDVTLLWRGLDDLVRVQGRETTYQARTRISVAQPADLRQTTLDNVPPVIISRYTQLPDSVPQRVKDLAQQVAGDLENPYDQARALEQFLRQYEYTLDVDSPPPGEDVVDYFLFDLQRGYCDYYASAMVVMARSLGLPARIAVGFTSQSPDENGRQMIRQNNGHSWAEVYFARYGWVEFEPTAGFDSPYDTAFMQEWGTRPAEDFVPFLNEPAPLPARDPVVRPVAWGKILTRIGLVVLAAAGLGFIGFWRYRIRQTDANLLAVFGRLQAQAAKLDQPILPQQTPAEFNEALQATLDSFHPHKRAWQQAEKVKPLTGQLTDLFVEHQYAPHPADHDEEAVRLWQKIKRPLWWLRLSKKLMK